MENFISEADTIAIGSMRKFPEGKMYNRCKHSLTLLSTDMYGLNLERFIEDIGIIEGIDNLQQ